MYQEEHFPLLTKKKKKIIFQHQTNKNPNPLIIENIAITSLEKPNPYEAFQQALYVPLEKK